MADTWEIDSPYGPLEIESDHQPTAEEAKKAIQAFAGASQKPQTPAPFNPPRFGDTPQPALLGASFNQAKDLVVGAGKGAAHTALDVAQLVHAIPGVRQALDATIGPPDFDKAAQDTAYTNTTQRIGGGLETAAELALPIGKVAGMMPTTAKAGAKFGEVMGAAKNVVVDTSKVGDTALKLADFAQHGGGTNWGPGPVRQLIQYLTDPKKPALTYEVGRDFAQNIGKLSVKDWQATNPAIGRQVAILAQELNQALGQAAAKAGKGREYAQAMTEYAKAKKLQSIYDAFLEGAQRYGPKAAATGAGTAAGLYLWKQLGGLFGSD